MQIEGINRSPFFDNIAPDFGSVKPAMGEYGHEIERYARQYGVDAEMVKAIMQKESGGSPNPITTKETAEFAQLNRETAAELKGRALTAKEVEHQLATIENICRALSEENFGSIYDERACDADDSADDDVKA